MKQRTKILTALFVMSAVEFLYAGRPLTIDDADPVEKGHIEIEAGAYYEYNCDCKHWDFPIGIAAGIIPSLEISASFGGQFEERTELEKDTETDFSDAIIAAKWQIIKECPPGNSHAIAPAVKIPVADDKKGMGSSKTDYDLTWIISCKITDNINAHINVGYSWIGGEEKDIIHYGIAADCEVIDTLQLVAEIFADKSRDNTINSAAMFNAGVRWVLNDLFTFDIAAGSGIAGETPDITTTIGLTSVF